MRITALNLQGFRNFELVRTQLDGNAHFFIGANGQGKTNFLEALHLVTAIRSFRTAQMRSLIGWETPHKEARLHYGIQGDSGDEESLEIQLKAGSKRVLLNSEPIRSMKEFLGRFPTVALSSEDIQILRGSPQLRRRFVDLTLASVDGVYFQTLRNYHRVLLERNALLRKQSTASLLNAFDQTLAPLACKLHQSRRLFLEEFQQGFVRAYQKIGGAEAPELKGLPHVDIDNDEAYLEALRKRREQDVRMKTTTMGPHRDDFRFALKAHQAKEFASEGQQRGLVLALRVAQIEWTEQKTGVKPVVLADDILGELDQSRRAGFWMAMGNRYQIFASGTQLPLAVDGYEWNYWDVKQGSVVNRS